MDLRSTRWLLILVLALSIIPSAYFAWSARDLPHFGYFDDDTLYVVAAQSLSEGAGYRILSLPDQPYQTKYPPVYAILLAAISRFAPPFPANLQFALLLNLLILPAYIALAWRFLLGFGFKPLHAAVLCLAMALSPAFVFLVINVMPELLFCSLVLLALSLAERARQDKNGLLLVIAAAVVSSVAYLTKGAALPLLLSVPLGLFLSGRRFRAALFVAVMGCAVAGWGLWARVHMTHSSDLATVYYTNYFGFHLLNVSWQNLPVYVQTNLDSFLKGIGGLLVFDPANSVSLGIIARLAGIASIFGAVRSAVRSGATQCHLFALLYAGQLVLWHFPPNERLLLPLFPLAVAGFWSEAGHVWRGLHLLAASTVLRHTIRAAGFAALAAIPCLMALMTCYGLGAFLPSVLAHHRQRSAEDRAAYRWILQTLPKEATFLAYFDAKLYLYTGHRASAIVLRSEPFYRSDAKGVVEPFYSVDRLADRLGASYIISTDDDYHTDWLVSDPSVIRSIFNRNPNLRVAYASPSVRIYRVERPAPAPVTPTSRLRQETQDTQAQ